MSRTALSICSLSLSFPMAFSLCFLVRHCEALNRCRASPLGCGPLPIFMHGLKLVPPQSVQANFPYGLKPSVAIILGSEPLPFVGDRYISSRLLQCRRGEEEKTSWRRMVATIVNSSNVEHQGGRCETGTDRNRWDCWTGKEVTGASGNLDEG